MIFSANYRTDLGIILRSVSFSVSMNSQDSFSIDPPLNLFPPDLLALYADARLRCNYDLRYRQIYLWLDSNTWINFVIPEPSLIPSLLAWWNNQNPYKIQLIGEFIPRKTCYQLLR